MSEEYIKGDNLLPWPPFHSVLTDHDKQAIAELNATGAAKVAAGKCTPTERFHSIGNRCADA